MATSFAFFFAAVAAASANDFNLGCPKAPSKIIYNHASMTTQNSSLFNTVNNFISVFADTQLLTWKTEVKELQSDVTIDLIVKRHFMGCWVKVYEIKGSDFCNNTPELILAYGDLLGLRSSCKPVVSGCSGACPFIGSYAISDFKVDPSSLSHRLVKGRTLSTIVYNVHGRPVLEIVLDVSISC